MEENKSVNIEGDSHAPIVTGDHNTVYISTTKLQTLQEAVTQWQSQTKILLNSNLVLKSREKEVEKLFSLLSQSPSKMIVVSPRSKEESYAFIINALNTQEEYGARVKILQNQETWDSAVVTEDSLILLYKGFTPTNIGVAITQGHFVVEAAESTNVKDRSHEIIELSKIKKSQQVSTLQEMGFDHEKAWKIIEDTKGFLHAIIQHPLLEPYERVNPEWVSKYSIDILTTILFINGWNRTNKEDIAIIERLSGLECEAFEIELNALRKEDNPPIRQVGNVWQVISKINLWDLVVNKISDIQFDKLKPIVLELFREIDPAYELAPEERSYAHIYEKVMKHSGLVRSSVADTLVMLSVFGDTILDNMQMRVDTWLKELFESNLNIEAWYSYRHVMSLLAEASPSSFLTALESSIDNIEATKIDELFIDSGDLMMGECNYCNLLWALESISWNTEYLVRVVIVLARLSDLDIKYGRNNQPLESLQNIFLGWISNSSATHEERVGIIENILFKKLPNTTFKLLIGLLPENRSFSSPISKPKYHNWDETLDDVIYEKDFVEYSTEINRLLFENLDNNLQHWHDVFDNIDKFYKKHFFQSIDKLLALDKSIFTDQVRLSIATIIREKVHRHRSYPNTDWALPKEFVDKLEEAFYFIEPEILIDKYQYLFVGMGDIDILDPIVYDIEDNERFKKQRLGEEEIVSKLRTAAIEEIISQEGFNSLTELTTKSFYAGAIGKELFSIYGDEYSVTMLEWLNSDERALKLAAQNYIGQYVKSKPVEELDFDKLSDIQKSEFILALPFGSKAFEVLKERDTNVQKLYWENIGWYYSLEKEDIEYFNWVIEQFHEYGVFYKALEIMSHMFCPRRKEISEIEINIELLFKILYEMDPNHKKLDRHSTSEVIKYLQKSILSDEYKRHLEWKYLMLQSFNPIYWERFIIQDPKAFVELVSWIYKSEKDRDDDADLSQDEIRIRANNAKELLERVQLFREYDDVEPMDVERLKHWITTAKDMFKEFDRIKIGDNQLGVLLAKSSREEDEVFPNKIVCETIEEYGNDEFDKGFVHEVLYPNGHRSTTRAPDEGGEQEYSSANKYQNYADKIKFIYPRAASILQKISNWYLNEAKREDIRNEL